MKRIKKLQAALRSKKVGAALISNPYNVRYLSNFVGSNGRLFVTPKKAYLVTDFRYFRSGKKQLPRGVEIYDQTQGLKKLIGKVKNLGIEEEDISAGDLKRYKKALKGIKLVDVSGVVEAQRIIKDKEEIKIMKEACKMTDKLLAQFKKTVKVGQTEDEMEWNLLSIARKLGADDFSFPAIICFGKDTADVHHIKQPKNKLKKGEPILLDMGITYKGYATDMTRMIYLSKPSKKEQELYDIVLKANTEAIKAIKVGKTCGDIDKVARDIIIEAGYGDRFGHSTGHGVGLEVHEAPHVGGRSKEKIQPGMVFTIEPGIYLDHLGGVRIEDMVYINEKGKVEQLTKSPK